MPKSIPQNIADILQFIGYEQISRPVPQAVTDVLQLIGEKLLTGAWFVSDVEAARIIGCSPSKLRQDRHKCRGIPYSRYGRVVRYSVLEIAKYMASTKVTPEVIGFDKNQ